MKILKNYRIFDEISQTTISNDSKNWCYFRLFLNILTRFQQEFSEDAKPHEKYQSAIVVIMAVSRMFRNFDNSFVNLEA